MMLPVAAADRVMSVPRSFAVRFIAVFHQLHFSARPTTSKKENVAYYKR
jgi:hypothetical protein